ncbi:zinc finger BED domain-containing protein RICESLEEPER 2-like [Neltuma alba]|uniref:zinc finger BED domain-containing protein RICESLEEPER 2-like n=1 Tax=Neltuma alba TaxID=207710 RepID=UPI0010A500F6|nr:zinc finger BED domain-containing protein RICESLEEPER 2-like [Prosopis alba]
MICGGDYLHLRCSAHILNLVVNDGLKELKNSFDSIRNAVKYVRSSPARLQKFKNIAELEKVDTTSLVCLDVNTRWNSTYLMLESALKFQKAFERLEDEDDDYEAYFARGSRNEGPPKASDWNKARMFLKFLKVFYDITLMFSSSLDVTSNTCFHQIALIHELLEENIVNADPLLMEMSLSMRSKYEKYWGQTENMNPLLIVAVILDPRYKLAYVYHIFDQLFHDVEVCMAMKIKIRDVLYRMFDEYSVGQATSSTSSNVSSVPPRSSTSTMLQGQGSRDPGRRWLASQKEKSSSDPQSELDRYLSSSSADDTPVDDDFDILAWWRVNSSKYKILSRMARDILAVPVSTVASESAFSTGGRIVDSYRSSLSPTMTEALICAQNWLLPGRSLSEFTSMLQEFDNFQETEGVVKTDYSSVTDVGEDVDLLVS